MSKPLAGVNEHEPKSAGDEMNCALCGKPVYPLRFGVWLIWVSLESGQICKGRTALDKELARRRADPGFMHRLRERIRDDRQLLDALEGDDDTEAQHGDN